MCSDVIVARAFSRKPAHWPGWCGLCLCLGLWLGGRLPLAAQTTLQWTTNFYLVRGGDLREIRQSLRQNRPWKTRHDSDAFTEWKVEWRFQVAPNEQGCRVTGFSTKTIVLVTLPRWVAPTNAPVSAMTSNAWQRYFRALGQHEAGHASFAFAAAAELPKRVAAVPAGSDCGALTKSVNELGEQVVREYRQRERDYDERTKHGTTQGVVLSFPADRARAPDK